MHAPRVKNISNKRHRTGQERSTVSPQAPTGCRVFFRCRAEQSEAEQYSRISTNPTRSDGRRRRMQWGKRRVYPGWRRARYVSGKRSITLLAAATPPCAADKPANGTAAGNWLIVVEVRSTDGGCINTIPPCIRRTDNAPGRRAR